jgi:hypothetical protein
MAATRFTDKLPPLPKRCPYCPYAFSGANLGARARRAGGHMKTAHPERLGEFGLRYFHSTIARRQAREALAGPPVVTGGTDVALVRQLHNYQMCHSAALLSAAATIALIRKQSHELMMQGKRLNRLIGNLTPNGHKKGRA